MPQLKGLPFPLELGTGAWGQKNRIVVIGRRKKFDNIFSRLDTIHERDRQTDRRTTAKTTLTHSVERLKVSNSTKTHAVLCNGRCRLATEHKMSFCDKQAVRVATQ